MIFAVIVLSVLCAAELVKIIIMKTSAREITEKLDEKLSLDTNTLIDIAASDRDMCRLADRLNVELEKLRHERLLCRRGDEELKNAVTNVSHDLRTPLTAACGYLELLRREELPPAAARYADRIEERVGALKTLTDELLRYSAAAAAAEPKYEMLCVNDVLEECIASFYGAICERGITPMISISEEKITRVSDRSMLTRIFGNIISNALKYSSGDLFISMTPDCIITFKNGADDLGKISVEKLFDRFYTVENANRSTGLGLSIAKLLTEQLGGTISACLEDDKLAIIIKL